MVWATGTVVLQVGCYFLAWHAMCDTSTILLTRSSTVGRVALTSLAAGETPHQMTWQGVPDPQGWRLGRLLA